MKQSTWGLREIFIGALAVLMAAPAIAAETTQTAPVRLEPVVVTAGRIEEKAKNVTQSVTVIPREDVIKNQNQDLGAFLRDYGLQVNAYSPGGTQSQISIRGMRTSLMGDDGEGTVLLLVNGRRMGTDNISLIPMVNVERVEIIKGPAAVQYGTSAVGGVVNVITRRGADLSAMVEAGVSSWEGYRAQGELAGSGYGFDISGGASWLTQNDNYTDGHGDEYKNTDINYNLAYNLSLGYTFLDEHRLGVNFQGVKADDIGSPGDQTWLTPDDRQNRKNQAIDLTYEGGYKDAGLSWMGRYFNGKYEYFLDSPGAPYTNDNDYQGAQAQVSFSRSILTLTGGLDWLKYDGETDSVWWPTKRETTQENMGLFLLAKLALLEERLILSGGLRYDYYKLEVPGRDDDYNRTTPSFGVAWHALDWLTLRGNYGQSYRIPQPTAVLGFNDGWYNYLPNPDLEPEKAQSWDVGFEIKHQSLDFGLSYFETYYKNKIASQSIGGDYQYYNIDGTSKFKGIEAQAGYDLGEALDWPFMLRAYGTLTHLFLYEEPDGSDVQFVSNTDMSYGLNFYHPGWGLDVDLRFIYFGHQNVNDWSTGGTARIGGDTTADLYITQVVHASDEYGTLSIKGEVRNIFDKYYETIKYYPMPGRSFYLGLRYDY